MRDLLTLLVIGGPVLWAILAYLASFFAVGLIGWAETILNIIGRRAA